MTIAPSEDLDQPGHPPSLIGVFAVRLKKFRFIVLKLLNSEGPHWGYH